MSQNDNSKKTKKRVGIWIRVSTDNQARGDSPKHHEKRALSYVDINGWKAVETYHLEGVSGKSLKDHPETRRMLKDVASGHITGLIFSKLARLARNTKELLEFADFFEEKGADLISLDEKIDTSSPAGRLFYTLIAAMAAWEREEIAARVRASVPIRAELGKRTGGVGPFGYHWVDGKLIPKEDEVPILQLMFDLYIEHRRFKTTARLLNERGHTTRRGNNFSDATVRRLLQDPTSKGHHRANYTTNQGSKSKQLKPEDEWVYQPVEPVISEETWDKANAIIQEMRAKRKPPRRKTVHLFSGLTFCHCGEKMYPVSSTHKYTCKECRNKIPDDVLESLFRENTTKSILSPEEIEAGFQEVDNTLESKEQEIIALKKEQRTLKADMDKVFRLYTEEKIDEDGFQRRNDPLEERMKELEEKIPILQGELDALAIEKTAREELIKEALEVQKSWPKLEKEQKRMVIETITDKIIIGEDEVNVELRKLPFDPEKIATTWQHNSCAVNCSISMTVLSIRKICFIM